MTEIPWESAAAEGGAGSDALPEPAAILHSRAIDPKDSVTAHRRVSCSTRTSASDAPMAACKPRTSGRRGVEPCARCTTPSRARFLWLARNTASLAHEVQNLALQGFPPLRPTAKASRARLGNVARKGFCLKCKARYPRGPILFALRFEVSVLRSLRRPLRARLRSLRARAGALRTRIFALRAGTGSLAIDPFHLASARCSLIDATLGACVVD
jgi:hypothetical protein